MSTGKVRALPGHVGEKQKEAAQGAKWALRGNPVASGPLSPCTEDGILPENKAQSHAVLEVALFGFPDRSFGNLIWHVW